MMMIHSLAKGDVLKYDEVFQTPWVYAHLNRKINLQQYIFDKNLSEIYRDKKP